MTNVDLRNRDLDELRDITAQRARKPHIVEQLEPEPKPSITELGKLSAEAVMQQWETAATGVEALGADVKQMIGKLRDEMVRCDENLKRLAETAAEIREQGKLAQALVERSGMQSDDIRATCEGLSKKLKG